MEDEDTYFYNRDNLQDILKEHPEYIKVYFKATSNGDKTTLSLSKNSGDQLYLVSNRDYDDLKKYLRKRTIEEHPAKKKNDTFLIAENKPEIAKKPKQQNLFSFIKKSDTRP
ncbi:uncharacterized protein VICG_00462 [Vittaforma corneae ATCC 50505]|uniref:Uncharacterized protein n=1 Tax=Vittaforma corneae (strain ATCC 50505) TaxID=993615 RepID=L2GP08_VITCO|nr:uncharacterized protein VICG_00462 [Vittaforma corneae ATCC 50505]ELA42364.1 hypothetical protein VICG_00462 [Vittaforma corneae ATCC 50505]